MKKPLTVLIHVFLILLIAVAIILAIYSGGEHSRIEVNGSSFDTMKIKATEVGKIKFYFKNENGERFSSIKNLKEQLKNNGENLTFATNGGIFSLDYSPTGLYIENNETINEINFLNGNGNFYMKPNGVFSINSSEAKIVESSRFKGDASISYALQSGPLLVLEGQINTAFNKESQNKYIRSGVGITSENDIIFAISNEEVSFYEFASLFQKELNCKNALYLDGAISKMYIKKQREELNGDFSVIIGVSE